MHRQDLAIISLPPVLHRPHLINRAENTDAGDQAVLQCANHGGQYCCDHNRDVNNVCCDQSDDSLFFALPKGNPTASIAKLGTPAAASGGGSNNNNFAPASSSSPQAFPQTSNSPTTSGSIPTVATFDEPPTAFSSPVSTTQSTPRPFAHSPSSSSSSTSTLIHSSTASASGRTSIVLLTSFITTPVSSPETASPAHPAASPSSSSSHHTSSNAAAIGGGVGGGVAVLLLASLIAFFLLRHRKRRKQRELQDATMQRPQTFLADQKDVGGLDYMYKGQDQGTPSTAQEGSPELDGTEIGGFGRRG
ncbi:MAG: hypothetical protein LQ338_007335, partial [Usnochroma carphineum]